MMLGRYFVLLLVIVAVSASPPCQEKRDKALDRRKNQLVVGGYIPQCDENGYYAPKQCKRSRCSCVDRAGKSLTTSFHISRSKDTDCNCVREQEDLQTNHIVGITLNCDDIGNYGRRQCIGDVCFCVDPRTKQPLGKPVPVSNENQLDC